MTDKRQYESLKYVFNANELRDLGEQLAREAQRVFDLEAEKKATTASYGASIKAANNRVADLAEKMNNGYELRDVECMVMLEDPRPGQKRIIRLDTNETVRVEPMTMGEMQNSFGFTEPGEPEGER
jgi:hypothetical protein